MSLIIYPDGQKPSLPSFSFYDGTETLLFDESIWTYFRLLEDGKRQELEGVTGIVKIIDKSEPLMRWAVKKSMEKLRRLLLGSPNFAALGPEAAQMLDDIIAEAKKADKEELEQAADTGHKAHDWIEAYIKASIAGDDLNLLWQSMPDDPKAVNACKASVGWMQQHKVKWVRTERRCYSRAHGYAGTMDGLARVSSCGNPNCCPTEFTDRLTLVDWKTSNDLYIEYLLQTASYQNAHEEETGEIIEDRWVIRLGKDDAEFDPWHMEDRSAYEEDRKAFLSTLDTYRCVWAVRDRMSNVLTKRRKRDKEKLAAARRIECLDAKKYKGSRKKKGCNGTEEVCEACNKRYLDKHPVVLS
jgi:hypothetical protein